MKKLKNLSLTLLLLFIAGNTLKAQCSFEVSISKNDVSCYGEANGTAKAEVTGSTGPYNFLWSNNNETTAEIENLKAQTYFVKVTDNNGCEVIEFVTIEEPEKIEVSLDTDHVMCNGENSGEIRLTSTGGTGSHDIEWSNGPTTAINSSLYSDDYDVTVTDENYCEVTVSVTVNEPPVLQLSYEVNDALGYGTSDGSIDISIEGGIAPYQYKWSSDNGFTSKSKDVQNLKAGNYEVIVTDYNECTTSKNIEVNQPNPIEASFDMTNVLCKNYANGEIEVTVTGGVAPYNYRWSNSSIVLNQTSDHITNLSADTYSLRITDSNGVSITKTGIKVEQPSKILASLTSNKTSCHDSNDGKIEVSVSGGTGNYSYLWDYNNLTTQNIDGIPAGDYSVRIVDENGCSLTAKATITQPEPLEINGSINPITCEDQSDGEILLSVSGGSSDYLFNWSHGETSKDVKNLSDGTYRVTVTDANNCQLDKEFYIEPGIGNCISIPNAFTPNGDNINDTWEIKNSHLYPSMTVKVFSREGSVVFESNGNNKSWDGKHNNRDVPSGTYYYIIDFKNGDEPYTGTVTIVR
ncbi:gliding motility-associated C-terminal domain-containing protein [Marinilabiliaceae bacterium ANBcel2]|nr:gliding motility-associated C-terminal domain-containing protein [Marinilabiliaceae bacterium ANBcel2]